MPNNLYAPCDLEVKSYLPEDLKRYAPEALYMLHLIECRRIFYKERRDAYVPLKNKYLQNIMGSRVTTPILESLRQHHLIERDKNYIVGTKCYGYRLGEKLRALDFKPTPCPDRIHKRLKKQEATLTLPIHLHLRDWLYNTAIDYEAAKKSLHSLNSPNEDFIALDMIHNRDLWFVPDAYGRCHTNITSLKSCLRQHLRIGKSPVQFVDVVNSQPLFFAVVVANHYNNDNSLKSFYSLAGQSGPRCRFKSSKPEQEGGEGKHTITICNLINHEDEYGPQIHHKQQQHLKRLDYPVDVKQYNKLAEQGQLYERLQALWGCDRATAKHNYFAQVLFCKVYSNEYRNKFREQFPNVVTVMDALKTSDYRHCGQMLQRAESAVVIHGACEALRKAYPHIPLLTIHDSIGTTPEHLDTVRTVLAESFRGTGIKPSLRVEGHQNAQDAFYGEIGVRAGDYGVGEFDLSNAV